MRKLPWVEILACLSLANLSFFPVWNGLLFYDREQSFYLHRLPPPAQYVSAALAVIGLGAVFFGLLELARWLRRGRAKVLVAPVLFLMILLPANVVRNAVSDRFAGLRTHLIAVLGLKGIIFIFAAGLVGFGFLLARIRGRAARACLLILAQFSPLFAFEMGESAWRLMQSRPADYEDRPLAAMQHTTPANPHVVWIIFDELDYRLAFLERPSSVRLPEFDRFRAQAISATDAFSPARDTSISVPSLLTGKQFIATKGSGPVTLYGGNGVSPMETVDVHSTIFSDVRKRGGNVAVVGWYLPYCRMFSDSVSSCAWFDNGNILNITGDAVAESAFDQTRSLFETSLFSPFGQSLTLRHAVRMVQDFRQAARDALANPDFDLVYLHYPVPHAPHPYNRFQKTFTRSNAGFEGYTDSLALADVLLGEIRAEMTRMNTWDGATILVTSDHPYRESLHLDGKADPRVPFLLKLPMQESPVVYDRPLHTLLTRDLLNAVFRGEVTSPQEAVAWFAKRK